MFPIINKPVLHFLYDGEHWSLMAEMKNQKDCDIQEMKTAWLS